MEGVVLDSDAISKLKQQVESRLSNGRGPQVSAQKFKKKSLDGSGAQRRNSDGHSQKQSVSGSPSSASLRSIGQKQQSNSLGSKAQRTNKPSKRKDREIPGSKDHETLDLKDEVIALGGDEEDLKLIQVVVSDSEFEDSTAQPVDKSLQKDLSKFMKSLPFEDSRNDISDEPTDADEDSENTGEDVDDPSAGPEPNRSSEQLIIAPQSDWHEAKLVAITASKGSQLSEKTIRDLHSYGKELLEKENRSYNDMNTKSSSHKFYKEMMASGTLTDKISALTLSVQESPLHNRQPLETLVALAKKRSRSQAVQVLGALKDLFGAGALLPSDRRLNYFAGQPALSNLPVEVFKNWNRTQKLPQPLFKEHLILWAYEDWLKAIYFEIIKVLEVWSNDEITYSRLKSVDYVYDLLKEKPEQEVNLLQLLVNKLGDPDKQVASRASAHLVQLQIPHPFMKPVIISSIEAKILFKPGETWHAKYYAIITLNQTVLNSGQQEVVERLLDIYFSMFLSILGDQKSSKTEQNGPSNVKSVESVAKKASNQSKKGRKSATNESDVQEKIISGILSGINRAYPYAASGDTFFEKRLDTLFKITHSSNFNTSIQALMLLQQLCKAHPAASDRFYRTLYESLLDSRLLTTSKHALYINLLYRSMKADTSVKRVQAFVKRLGQILSMHQPPFVCAIVYLIKDLEDTFPGLHSLIDQPEAYDSEGEEDHDTRTKLSYDGKKRDPQFSNADRCCIWEMHPLGNHFHPSVSLFVSKLLTKQKIESKPDLSLHTLINFLDRFVYRNPKKITDALKGVSLMQPMAVANTSDLLVSGRASSTRRRGPALNTAEFARMSGDKIQADEIFFHKYFSTKEQGKEVAQKKKEKKRKNIEADDEEENDNEEEIWKALVDSRPELDGDESDEFEDDAGFSDLESDEEDSDEEDREVETLGDEHDLDLDIEEEDAFFDSDEELDLPDSQDEQEGIVIAATNSAQIANSRGRKKRKLLKDLPTFASAEEYASMMQEDEEEL